jgi:predicted ATPase
MEHYGEKKEAVAAELALLFEAARDPARAVDHWLLAARQAVRIGAHQEAAALARRGLELLPRVPESPARAQQERALLIALGVSLIATQGFAAAEVEQTYLRVRALCQEGEDVPALFAAVYGLWNVYLLRCELSRCMELAAQMFTFARGQTDPVFRLLAHNVVQQPLFHAGQLAVARGHQAQGLALYDTARHRTLTAVYGEDPGVGCLAYRAVTLWHLGYPEQGLRAALAARALAAELAIPFNAAQASYYAAFTHLCRREVVRAGELAEALLELCRDQGFALLAAGGLILQGWGLSEQGQHDEGIRQLRQGLADWQATGALSHRPFHLALMAEALGKAGRADEALAALAEGVTISEKTGERFWEAELHRLRGELTLLGGAATSAADAESCFRQALGVAAGQGAKSLELRAALSLGLLLREQGRQDEGYRLVTATFGWFTEGLDTLDLQEARTFCEAGA